MTYLSVIWHETSQCFCATVELNFGLMFFRVCFYRASGTREPPAYNTHQQQPEKKLCMSTLGLPQSATTTYVFTHIH